MEKDSTSREEAVKKAYEEAKEKSKLKEALKKENEAAKKNEAENAENQEESNTENAKENEEENTLENSAAENEEASENSEEQEDGKDKKKGFFKKKEKKDERDEQIAELKDSLLRNRAEFENFRKRSEKEKSQMFEIGAKSIVEKILPVIDNFERGFDTLKDEEKDLPFAAGMKKIYEQMLTSLSEAGVKPIEALGQEFNPDFHNAIMHEDNDEVGENIIVQEFQKGYMFRDTVVRYSMVKVAN